MWHVVQFPNEGGVEVIPQHWYIRAQNECFWPPNSYSNVKIRKMIEQSADPMADWKVHPVLLMGSYDDFKVANRKAGKAKFNSDLSSSNNENIPIKRKRKRNPKYALSDDSIESTTSITKLKRNSRNKKKNSTESEQNSSTDDTDFPVLIRKSVFSSRRSKSESPCNNKSRDQEEVSRVYRRSKSESPFNNKSRDQEEVSRVYRSDLVETCYHGGETSTSKLHTIPVKNRPMSSGQRASTLTPTQSTSTDKHAPSTLEILKSLTTTPKTSLLSQSIINTPDIVNGVFNLQQHQEQAGIPTQQNVVDTSYLSDNDFKKMMVNEISSLHLKVDRLNEGINILQRIKKQGDIIVTSDYENQVHTLNSKCPVKNVMELNELEEWLQSDTNYKMMIHEFQRIGGSSYGQSTRKIMYRILTNQVAVLFSWDGAKKKEPFKKLKIARGILEALKMQYLDVRETDIIDAIKQWLVKAKERLGKEKTHKV